MVRACLHIQGAAWYTALSERQACSDRVQVSPRTSSGEPQVLEQRLHFAPLEMLC